MRNDGAAAYVDGQVLLLESQDVATRAVRIANGTIGRELLTPSDFVEGDGSLKVTPPAKSADPGTFGGSTIAVSFSWPDPKVAQIGANAVLQAFDAARSDGIKSQGDVVIAGLDRIIADSGSLDQRANLLSQKAQVVTDQQIDLAQHPQFAWAVEPRLPINGDARRMGAIGLLVGAIVGAGAAYARASRRGGFNRGDEPAAVYGAPMIGEVRIPLRAKIRPGAGARRVVLPIITEPRSAAAEAFRFAAGSIERVRAEADQPPRAVAFASPREGSNRSIAVANVALALAAGGTRVLAVDADFSEGNLTALLLPGCSVTNGFEQVVIGQCSPVDCIQPSPWDEWLSVLGVGPVSRERVTGAAYSKAVEKLMTDVKPRFDLILIDCPALLSVADGAEALSAADGAVIVLSSQELARDHVELADRLELIRPDTLGYVFFTTGMRSYLARYRRKFVPARRPPEVLPSAASGPFRPCPRPRHPSRSDGESGSAPLPQNG